MLKRLILIVATMLVASCFSCSNLPSAHNAAQYELIKEEMDATVALVMHPRKIDDDFNIVEDTTRWKPFCSGVWIGPKQILSAAHCAKDSDTINIAYYRDMKAPPGREAFIYEAHEAKVVLIDAEADLVLLQVEKVEHFHYVAEISSEKIYPGDKVEIVGQPLGLLWSPISGEIVAHRWLEVRGTTSLYTEINSNTTFGNSGCAAFMNGKVVGIASFLIRGGPGKTFYVSRDVIVSFLDRG